MPKDNPTEKEKQERRERVRIVKFFASLYKAQLRVKKSAKHKIIPVPMKEAGSEYTYEYQVKREDRIETRRMTISMIGEGTGSKSSCFKVVYDNLLVVKIPPVPILEFSDYIQSISGEVRIAGMLGPELEYVAPGVTVVMKKVFTLPNEKDLSPLELEKQYIAWLKNKKNKKHQKWLKIKDSFVFFMDLSKHIFLSTFVEKIHSKEGGSDLVHQEIMKSHELLWDILGFEGKYGSESLSSCFDMNKVFSEYETNLRSLLEQYGLISSVSSYERRKWFFDRLAGKKIKLTNKDYPKRFFSTLVAMMDKIIQDYKPEIESYLDTIREYIHSTTFSQNRSTISGVVSKVLELLAILNMKKIAIRDLKPDNLFVVENKDFDPRYPGSLEISSLGLIDFETAVSFDTSGEKKIDQPMQAGTPSYATPSHLFKNEILTNMLDDPAYIFHFQDWYAAIGIMYFVATGETLFQQTRKLLGKIRDIARKAAAKKQPASEVFKVSSRIFWSSAVHEFKERIESKKRVLRSLEITIPENAVVMIRKDARYEKEKISRAVKKRIESQVIFSSDKNRKSLIRSSTEEIRRLKTKWERGMNTPKTTPEMRKEIIRLLADLETLKVQADKHEQILSRIDHSYLKMDLFELLEVMFNIVFKSMYKMEWGELSMNDRVTIMDESQGSREDTTILYESTIMFDNDG